MSFIKTSLRRIWGQSVTADIDFLLKMYCKGSIDMTVEWVLSDMPISIDDIVKLLIEALPQRLEPFILNIKK